MKYCNVCGKEIPFGADRCDECGTPVNGEYQEREYSYSQGADHTDAQWNREEQTQGGYSYSQSGSGYDQNDRSGQNFDYYSGQGPVYEKQSGARKGFAIASMVLGIVGLVGCCCSMVSYGVLSILLGVVGLIMGILGLKSDGKGFAIAGIVMASLNIVIGILLLILMIASYSMTVNMSAEEIEALIDLVESMEAIEALEMVKGFFLN